MLEQVQKIGVIGSGTMGNGIAQVSAMAGCAVTLVDIDDARLQTAKTNIQNNLEKGVSRGKVAAEDVAPTMERITLSTTVEALADVDLVIEAVPESLPLKQSIFRQLNDITKSTAILASNTSSLPITQIASVVSEPGRVIGMHFFNPVHINKLLEVVTHERTTEQTLSLVHAFAAHIGKSAITVKDSPGFASSRLGIALGMEAIRMVEEGVASAEDIDTAMTLGYRHPMGPLKLTDLVGLDVRMNIAEHLAKTLKNPAFEPPALLKQMVQDGKLGQKSGEGFYQWNKR